MMTLMRRAAMVASAILLAAGAMQTSLAQLPAIDADGKPTLAPLMRQVTPAVVNIAVVGTTRVARNPLLDDPFFRRFFDLPDQPEEKRRFRNRARGRASSSMRATATS